MTVSHMFVNRKQIDAGTNLQLHERNQAKPQPDDKITIGYNPKDAGF
jgi:hypothetical protein